jgi:hypothetical protein
MAENSEMGRGFVENVNILAGFFRTMGIDDFNSMKDFFSWLKEYGVYLKTNSDNMDSIISTAEDLKGLHSYCGWIKAPAIGDEECVISEDGSAILSYTDLRYKVLLKENNLSDLEDVEEALHNLGFDEIIAEGE